MKTIQSTMETTAVFDDTGRHRFLLQKTWEPDKKCAAILMIYPCSTDAVQSDLTTLLTINNTAKLGFGSVKIVNLFSKINVQVGTDDDPNDSENDKMIVNAVKESDCLIIAFGKGGMSNKQVQKRQAEVLQLLEPFKDRLVTIQDRRGYTGFHPLTPSIRGGWVIVPYEFPNFEHQAEVSHASKKNVGRGRKKVSART